MAFFAQEIQQASTNSSKRKRPAIRLNMFHLSGAFRTAFYHWRQGLKKPSGHQRENLKLKQEIQKIRIERFGTYGIPRMTKALKAKGFEVNHKRVWWLMKEEGLQGVVHKTRSS